MPISLGHDDRFAAAMAGGRPVVTLAYLRRAGLDAVVMGRDGALQYMKTQAGPGQGAQVGQPWWTLWPQDRWPELRKAVTRAGLGETATITVASLGTVTLTPVRDRAGVVTHILAVYPAVQHPHLFRG